MMELQLHSQEPSEGPANTTYGENTGVLELSKVYDPRVIRIAAVFAIALHLFQSFRQ